MGITFSIYYNKIKVYLGDSKSDLFSGLRSNITRGYEGKPLEKTIERNNKEAYYNGKKIC